MSFSNPPSDQPTTMSSTPSSPLKKKTSYIPPTIPKPSFLDLNHSVTVEELKQRTNSVEEWLHHYRLAHLQAALECKEDVAEVYWAFMSDCYELLEVAQARREVLMKQEIQQGEEILINSAHSIPPHWTRLPLLSMGRAQERQYDTQSNYDWDWLFAAPGLGSKSTSKRRAVPSAGEISTMKSSVVLESLLEFLCNEQSLAPEMIREIRAWSDDEPNKQNRLDDWMRIERKCSELISAVQARKAAL
ncbi:hypothetical protein K461DRAFT_318927 [Myriangium duriaei CBS 260.36]|uniref:Uncharacterized protein n=1 Tax=Myriangium duriaei CBS 260.36 TaxID=1168546 RepID=A0A9P4MNM2_9PEZI|nr:hypothetical protein K461DRAFT_318927 [Myriangium duriaei CBS 260.36]